MYFTKSISEPAKRIHQTARQKWSFPKWIVFIAFMGALSSLFQSMGGFLPGIGFIISPLATAPIVLSFILSFRMGLSAYALTLVLLLLIQPSELIVFPFTTGLLGAGLGAAFYRADRRISILLSGGILLFLGIAFLLYGVGFPVLGPGMTSSFSWGLCGLLFGFSIAYSWLWTEISKVLLQRFSKIL